MAKMESREERRKALKKMRKDNRALVRWQSQSQKTNFLVEGETLGQKPVKRKPRKPKPLTEKEWREMNKV